MDDTQIEEAVQVELKGCYVCHETWKALKRVALIEKACETCNTLFTLWEHHRLLYVRTISRPAPTSSGIATCDICAIKAQVKEVPYIVLLCGQCCQLHDYSRFF